MHSQQNVGFNDSYMAELGIVFIWQLTDLTEDWRS